MESILTAQQQPKDRFTVVVINDGKEVGHLRIGKSGKICQNNSFFSSRRITESMKNRESLARQKAEGMPRVCLFPVGLKLSGQNSYVSVSVLKEELLKAV